MGHIRLGQLPRTRAWDEVVELVARGRGTPAIAAGASQAARELFERSGVDDGFIEAVRLLATLPHAARGRADEYLDALRSLGLDIESAPGVFELVSAVSDAVDTHMKETGGRSDVGEMGRLAVTETLTAILGGRSRSLFETTPEDVRRELAALATNVQFGTVARAFFARFTERVLTFFLSRELSNHVGAGRRFGDMAEHAAFNAALALHCQEAARIVEDYSGDWLSKKTWEGSVDRDSVRGFVFNATRKLRAELANREPSK